MTEYKVKISRNMLRGGWSTELNDEVYAWLNDNKVFGWSLSKITFGTTDYYIYFTNTTDAMLFTLRWS